MKLEVPTLTTGVDTWTGAAGNDKFVAVDGQWTVLDAIDGGSGTNTFTVAQTAEITIPVGAAVKNIQTASLARGRFILIPADNTAWTGLTDTPQPQQLAPKPPPLLHQPT